LSLVELADIDVVRGRQTVLDHVSLRLDRPGLYGVIGPNGGGKSTLLSVITGALAPVRGTVRVFGQTPSKAASRLALVPQAAGFDRSFPVSLEGLVKTALIGPGLFSRPGPDGAARVAEALAKTGTADLATRPLSALSGGELQRALIARALAVAPELMLLDEPTASVDQDHADRLFEMLCDLAQTIPVVVVSHSLAHVAAHCTRVFCVNRTLWEAPHPARAADLAAEIFTRDVRCHRHEAAP